MYICNMFTDLVAGTVVENGKTDHEVETEDIDQIVESGKGN